jgi:hypothetical protein
MKSFEPGSILEPRDYNRPNKKAQTVVTITAAFCVLAIVVFIVPLQGRLFPSLVIKAILLMSKSTPCSFHFQKRLLLLLVFGSLGKEGAVRSIITEFIS